jgi:hypothetical protein
MTVYEFAQKNNYKILSGLKAAREREITGVYICDLLSMAMARISDGNLWITVHTNINVVAVALLANASCIVIPESIEVEDNTIKKAEEKGVIIISAHHTSYDISIKYYTESGRS